MEAPLVHIRNGNRLCQDAGVVLRLIGNELQHLIVVHCGNCLEAQALQRLAVLVGGRRSGEDFLQGGDCIGGVSLRATTMIQLRMFMSLSSS